MSILSLFMPMIDADLAGCGVKPAAPRYDQT